MCSYEELRRDAVNMAASWIQFKFQFFASLPKGNEDWAHYNPAAVPTFPPGAIPFRHEEKEMSLFRWSIAGTCRLPSSIFR